MASAYYYGPYQYFQGSSADEDGWAYVEGEVYSAELPTFEYYKLGNKTFNGDDYCCYFPGHISFGDGCRWTIELDDYATIDLDPIPFEVKTSLGSLSGSEDLPDTASNFSLSSHWLDTGQSLTMSWSGDADFYWVSWGYEWDDDVMGWGWTDADTMIVGTSLTLPGSNFSYDGEVTVWGALPVNGPYPQPGADANMSGDGSGFFYYSNYTTYWDMYTEVEVGEGLPLQFNRDRRHDQCRPEEHQREVLEAIGRRLGLR
jgi:hypothetical protein